MHHLVILIDSVHHSVSMCCPPKKGRKNGLTSKGRISRRSAERKSFRTQALDDCARTPAGAVAVKPEHQPQPVAAGNSRQRGRKSFAVFPRAGQKLSRRTG